MDTDKASVRAKTDRIKELALSILSLSNSPYLDGKSTLTDEERLQRIGQASIELYTMLPELVAGYQVLMEQMDTNKKQ